MWLLHESYFVLIQQAIRSGFVETAEHRLQIEAVGFGPERISAVKGTVATINITGMLTQEPDIMAMLFGGGNTTYPEIIGAIAAADADDDVKQTSIFIDSPGGQVFETCTIVVKNKIYIPVPDEVRRSFVPVGTDRKRFEVRYNLLFREIGQDQETDQDSAH